MIESPWLMILDHSVCAYWRLTGPQQLPTQLGWWQSCSMCYRLPAHQHSVVSQYTSSIDTQLACSSKYLPSLKVCSTCNNHIAHSFFSACISADPSDPVIHTPLCLYWLHVKKTNYNLFENYNTSGCFRSCSNFPLAHTISYYSVTVLKQLNTG